MELTNLKYKITFFSYWHIGGKDGATMKVDNAVLKDKNGLPYIGGKTLKGLIRDGACFIISNQPTLIETKDFINVVFGKPDRTYSIENNKKHLNKFTSARIHQNLTKKLKGLLFHDKTSIEITDNKQAKNHSLRTMEQVMPVELYGTIENVEKSMIEEIGLCLSAVKKLGLKRNRGLGRCKIELLTTK